MLPVWSGRRTDATGKLHPASGVAQVAAATAQAVRKRPAAFPRVAVTSSESGAGLAELRAEVLATISARGTEP